MRTTLFLVMAWVLGIGSAHGWFGRESRLGDYSTLMQLWGDRSFSAKVVVQQVDKKGRATELARSEYAYSKGRLRVEMRVGETAAGQKRKEAVDGMAGLGMDHIVMLMLPQEKGPFMIYPALAAYCQLEDQSAAGETGLKPKITRQELGKETVEGRECVKSLVTIEEGKNKVQITVWEAIDLNRFPIQTEMTDNGTLIRTTFKDLKLAAPPEGLFELPKGYTRYNSVQEMMMGAMQRMLGGGE